MIPRRCADPLSYPIFTMLQSAPDADTFITMRDLTFRGTKNTDESSVVSLVTETKSLHWMHQNGYKKSVQGYLTEIGRAKYDH